MNVIISASEAFPFCKTGGLADVAGEKAANVIFPPGGPLQSAPDRDTNPLRLESGPELGKKG